MTRTAFADTADAPVYDASWESLSQHEAAPEWFRDAKLGIYFHWGPYSVPAYGSAWYPRDMYLEGSDAQTHHINKYGPVTEFGYHDFIPLFTAQHFDAEEWAELFESSGAKFAGPVAQHHDGFAMWGSQVNPWNAKDMGPKQDVLGELFTALRKRNLKTIATFHHARLGQRHADDPENWGGFQSHYPYHPDLPTSTTDPKLRKLYGNFDEIEEFNRYWLDQVNEVVDQYSPDIVWFDSWLNRIPAEYRQEMAANYLNHARTTGQEVVLCHKQADLPTELSVLDIEQGGRREIHPLPWLTDVTLGETRWMYVEGHPTKEASLVVRNMIDVWSKNGNVLLNIAPRADGTIPAEQRKVLREIGQWLDVHGEAVYGTRPFDTFGTGPSEARPGKFGGQSASTRFTSKDVRFTLSKDRTTLYAFFLGKPDAGSEVSLFQLAAHRYPTPTPIRRITLVGTDIEIDWKSTPDDFILTMPEVEMNELATVFKFDLSK